MLRSLLTWIVLGVSTLVLGSAAIVAGLLWPGGDRPMRIGQLWSRIMLGVAGTRPEYVHADRIPRDGAVVYIANHQSNLDIWVLTAALPPTARFVAKESLFRVPVLGPAMRAAGFIAIDRTNRARAMQSLAQAAERVRSGKSPILFPEGTRSKDGRLAPFKKGAFHLALQAGVPVQPVAISGTWPLMPPGGFRVRPGRPRVTFLPTVDPALYTPREVERLSADVRSAISAHLAPEETDAGPAQPDLAVP